MFTNPGTPNLTDYVSFLYGVVGIPTANLPTANGFATGGSNGFLQDTLQNWLANQWAGYSVVDVIGGQTASVASSNRFTLNFLVPVANPVNVGDAYLVAPDIILTSLSIAQEIVNTTLNLASATIYTLAVYNLAADRLINYAMDVANQTYFRDLRKTFRLTEVSVGVPSQVSDQGTAVGILNPEQMRLFTLQDLQTMKTSYGRQYMAFAQMYGRSIWGIS
jgi:hypothetical protein